VEKERAVRRKRGSVAVPGWAAVAWEVAGWGFVAIHLPTMSKIIIVSALVR
jgi:hypothetical protein